MKKARIKAILSTLLMLLFLILAITGALLYFGKTGLIWGFQRHALRSFHFWVAVFMCALISAHLALNCRLFLSELNALFHKSSGKGKTK